jgi:integrase
VRLEQSIDELAHGATCQTWCGVWSNFLRNIVVIISETGLRYKKELLPMKKAQVDLENAIVHIADSKTVNGIGDMPMTPEAREAFQRQIEETPGSEYFSEPEIDRKQAVHHEPAKGVGGNAEKGRYSLLCTLRVEASCRLPDHADFSRGTRAGSARGRLRFGIIRGSSSRQQLVGGPVSVRLASDRCKSAAILQTAKRCVNSGCRASVCHDTR